MKMNKLLMTVLKVLLAGFLIFSFGISALNAAGYSANLYIFGALALSLAAVFHFAFSGIKKFFLVLGSGTLGAVIYFAFVYNLDIKLLSKNGGDFFNWLANYLSGNMEFDVKYGLLFGCLLFLLVTILVIASEKFGWSQIVVIGGGIAYFGYLWFSYIDTARVGGLVFISIGLCRYGLTQFERKIINLEKNSYTIEDNLIKGTAITIAVITLISLGTAVIIPLSVEPVYWEWLSDKTVETFPFIVNLKNEFEESRDYGYYNRYENSGGIGHAKRFGEPVKLSDKPVLEVVTSYKKSLYLRGSVYDLYAGSSWQVGKSNETEYNSGDIIAKKVRTNPSATEDVKASIKHIGLISSSAFTPFETYRIDGQNAKIYVDGRNRVFFSKLIPKKAQYSISSRIPVVDIKLDYGLISSKVLFKSSNGTDSLSEVSRLDGFKNNLYYSNHEVFSSGNQKFDLEVKDDLMMSSIYYNEGSGAINYYLVPKDLSVRVRELAFSILKEVKLPEEAINPMLSSRLERNANGDELLKATAIAEYLRSHYEYTLTPPSRPADRELVDYFLFESKQGYCVHFATAMTMLLRSVGIPARYVDGFVSEYSGADNRVVKANKAHAWVEVYLSSLGGWYTFEPTPIMSAVLPNQIVIAESTTPDNSTGEGNNDSTNNSTTGIKTNPRLNRADIEDASDNKLPKPTLDKSKIMKNITAAILYSIAIILILLFLIRFIKNLILPKIRIKNLKRQSGEKQLTSFIELLTYLGVFLGIKRRRTMTLNEFVSELRKNILYFEQIKNREDLVERLEKVVENYHRARYGDHKLGEGEVLLMEQILVELDYAGVCRLGQFGSLKRKLLYTR